MPFGKQLQACPCFIVPVRPAVGEKQVYFVPLETLVHDTCAESGRVMVVALLGRCAHAKAKVANDLIDHPAFMPIENMLIWRRRLPHHACQWMSQMSGVELFYDKSQGILYLNIESALEDVGSLEVCKSLSRLSIGSGDCNGGNTKAHRLLKRLENVEFKLWLYAFLVSHVVILVQGRPEFDIRQLHILRELASYKEALMRGEGGAAWPFGSYPESTALGLAQSGPSPTLLVVFDATPLYQWMEMESARGRVAKKGKQGQVRGTTNVSKRYVCAELERSLEQQVRAVFRRSKSESPQGQLFQLDATQTVRVVILDDVSDESVLRVVVSPASVLEEVRQEVADEGMDWDLQMGSHVGGEVGTLSGLRKYCIMKARSLHSGEGVVNNSRSKQEDRAHESQDSVDESGKEEEEQVWKKKERSNLSFVSSAQPLYKPQLADDIEGPLTGNNLQSVSPPNVSGKAVVDLPFQGIGSFCDGVVQDNLFAGSFAGPFASSAESFPLFVNPFQSPSSGVAPAVSLPTIRAWLELSQVTLEWLWAQQYASLSVPDSLHPDFSFSSECCQHALTAARRVYFTRLPTMYNSTFHNRRTQLAIRVFRSLARGPLSSATEASLLQEFLEHWRTGHRRCDAVSLTNRPCVHAAHDSHSYGKTPSLVSMPHSSNATLQQACNCGRTVSVRDDPFDLLAANTSFYFGSPCCSHLESLLAKQLSTKNQTPASHGSLLGIEEPESDARFSKFLITPQELGWDILNWGDLSALHTPAEPPSPTSQSESKNTELLGGHGQEDADPSVIRVSSNNSDRMSDEEIVKDGVCSPTTHPKCASLAQHNDSTSLDQDPSQSSNESNDRLSPSIHRDDTNSTSRPETPRQPHVFNSSGNTVYSFTELPNLMTEFSKLLPWHHPFPLSDSPSTTHLGYEYECTSGHRWFLNAFSLTQIGLQDLVDDHLHIDVPRLVKHIDLPIYVKCMGCKLGAQLQRIYVCAPPSDSHQLTFKPTIRVYTQNRRQEQRGELKYLTLGLGLEEPVSLSPSRITCIRLPYVYSLKGKPLIQEAFTNYAACRFYLQAKAFNHVPISASDAP